MKSLKNIAGFGRRMLRSSLALLSVVGAIGRAGPMEEEGGMAQAWPGHVARRCFGTKWCDDVPGARSTRDGNEDCTPAMRTTAVLLSF